MEEEAEEPYFTHELTSPQPIYVYGRDVLSPRSISEPSSDKSRSSSELTFSEYVILLATVVDDFNIACHEIISHNLPLEL